MLLSLFLLTWKDHLEYRHLTYPIILLIEHRTAFSGAVLHIPTLPSSAWSHSILFFVPSVFSFRDFWGFCSQLSSLRSNSHLGFDRIKGQWTKRPSQLVKRRSWSVLFFLSTGLHEVLRDDSELRFLKFAATPLQPKNSKARRSFRFVFFPSPV